MTQHSTGDKLASGQKTAQFSTSAGLSDFSNDLIYMTPEELVVKYGISEAQVEMYKSNRDAGNKLPDLVPVAIAEQLERDRQEAAELGYKVTDRRLSESKPVEAIVEKYPAKEYTTLKPILDRILIKRVNGDAKEEELSDGSTRNKKTGFITPAKWRQHNNVGIVLAIGDFVVMGDVKTSMWDIVRPGDRVTFGDYNTEKFTMDEAKVEAMCDELKINYTNDPEGLRVVYVQNIRGIEHPLALEDNTQVRNFVDGEWK
jgi:co-chaperonin GroES (HSP10)